MYLCIYPSDILHLYSTVHQAGESVQGLEGRLVQLFLYYKTSEDDNQYAHPIDAVPIVDLL